MTIDRIELRKWTSVLGDWVLGNPKAHIAVVTCGSYNLPRQLVNSRNDDIAIAGFCEVENEGIAKILQNVCSNPNIRVMIIAGERVKGHEPGQTIISLYENGIDGNFTIIGSNGTIPTLLPRYFRNTDPFMWVSRLQQQIVKMVDLRYETDLEKILNEVDKLRAQSFETFPGEPLFPPVQKVHYTFEKLAGLKYDIAEIDVTNAERMHVGNPLFFSNTQLMIYDIGGTKIGGQRGEYPCVLAGTIFYKGDKIVEDSDSGLFDKKLASDYIYQQELKSYEFEIPSMVHVVGETSRAIESFLLFVIERTDSPVIVDSPDTATRIAAIQLSKDMGFDNRIIYNSIFIKDETEIKTLAEIGGVDYAIILPYDLTVEERIVKTNDMLNFAKDVVKKPILDPGVPKLGEGGFNALHAAWVLKDIYGFPTAIGIHNLHSRLPKKEKELSAKSLDFGFNYAFPSNFGIDINMYGPIKKADKIFPMVAAIETMIADELIKTYNISPRPPHPYYKLGLEG
jgi:tetrahydromethanopterin S-methyltransferase subunit H